MKNAKIGKIDISALNRPPEKHEYETAKYFADRGLDVVFLKPTNISGQSNPDFVMAGNIWETKSLTTSEVATLKRRLNQATKQSEHIIIDLRRISAKYETDLLRALVRKSKSSSIKTLVVIKKSGGLLTLKGKFDII